MKVIYVCSPYRGGTPEEIQRNVDYAVELTKEALFAGYYPITPHLYITACLDDTKPDERMMGTGAALALLERCDAVMIGKRYGISEGMAAEITKATDIGIPTFTHSERTLFKQLTIQCDMSGGFPKTTVFVDNEAVNQIEEISFTHEAGLDPVLTMKRTPKEGGTDGTGKKL